MHLLIDLQGAQTTGSRQRGIGRYTLSLALEMVRQAVPRHRVSLLLNDRFPESIASLRQAFSPWVAPCDVHVLSVPPGCRDDHPHRQGMVQVAEALREALVAEIAPDALHISSLFEGHVDDAVVSVPAADARRTGPLIAATLYDLIPWCYPDRYLGSPPVRAWYERRLQQAQQVELLLAISESSRREALDAMVRHPQSVVNIAAAVGEQFRPRTYTPQQAASLHARYGLRPGYVLYTGGIDFRKNIERLIDAYAQLPAALREQHHLVVVCAIAEQDRARLGSRVAEHGLAPDAVCFTGFVPEDDLVALYNLATLFVFPSLHEGFGLPVLEAMACGAPSIGSHSSSVPEVLGLEEALFDPCDTAAIRAALARALGDVSFRSRLREHGLRQAATFSWEASAQRALAALEQALQQRAAVEGGTASAAEATVAGTEMPPVPETRATARRRPRLAYLSPLPPQRSGIADYSAVLLPQLARHYEIELIIDDAELAAGYRGFTVRDSAGFVARAASYDRVLYQMGNSHYHQHMLHLIRRVPGVVVLHDFFLSGLLYYCERMGADPRAFRDAVHCTHGYPGLRALHEQGPDAAVLGFPANRPFLDSALGVLVNSRYAIELAEGSHGRGFSQRLRQLPFLNNHAPLPGGRQAARAALGIADDEFLVCSFGHLAPTKLNIELLHAWRAAFADSDRVRLVLVGAPPGADYWPQVQSLLAAGPNASATGFIDADTYARWLAAADVGVQLRTRSRGETSVATYDCLASGLALVFNAHGSAAELPGQVGLKLDDPLQQEQLIAALRQLHSEPALRERLGAAGRQYVQAHHTPERVAQAYREHIEAIYLDAPPAREMRLLHRVARTIAADPDGPWSEGVQQQLAGAIVRNRRSPRPPILWLDIGSPADTALLTTAEAAAPAFVAALSSALPPPWQLVCVHREGADWRTAHTRVAPWLGFVDAPAEEPVEPACHDSWLCLLPPGPPPPEWHHTPALYAVRSAAVPLPASKQHSGAAQHARSTPPAPEQAEHTPPHLAQLPGIVAWVTGEDGPPSCLALWPPAQ